MALLYELAHASNDFEVRVRPLLAGDYFIAGAVVVERKTRANFVASLLDGRPFSLGPASSPHAYWETWQKERAPGKRLGCRRVVERATAK